MSGTIFRRSAFALLFMTSLVAHQTVSEAAHLGKSPLATRDQLAAEKLALDILADPKVRGAVAAVRATLTSDPAAASPEGQATLDHALALWTNCLVMREIAGDTLRPIILWATEDTPHSWFGHDFPGMGVAGDNPDNIYRSAYLDGAHRYEIRGHVPHNGPVQFSIELVHGSPGKIVLTTLGKGHVDMGNQLGMLTDRTTQTDTHGNFVVTIDATPADGRQNHLQTQSGPLEITIRNTLSDWHQTPVTLSIRRVDGTGGGTSLTESGVASRVAGDLPGFVAGWAKFKEGWLGNPPPNTLAGPLRRDGGWGFAAGGQYNLRDDEAIVVTTTSGGARYTGLQALDRWFMAPDSRSDFTSRNISQTVANADGSVTYVISPKDPGVFNWISTAGYHQGFVNFRWQQVPAGADPRQLVKSYQIVELAALKSILPAETRWVSPQQRAAQLRQRAADYELRIGR